MKDNRSLEQKIREVHNAVLEAAFDRNTKIRMKMSNVGRPTDNVKDETSKLAKQGEIQRKIIEDSEYGMARNELETAKRAIDRLNAKMGKGEGELEAWVQAKITKAADYLDTVADYIESGSVKEEVIDEAGRVLPDLTKKEPEKKHSKEYLSRMPKKRENDNWKAYVKTGAAWAKPDHVKEDTAVASVSTKDTPKEQPESKNKKKDDGKDLMEPGTIKGGKTEVDTEPTTDDRDDDGKKINKNEKATKAANAQAGVKEEIMNTTKHFGLPADLIAAVTEALKGNQHKIDKNHNGKIDAQDFKILKGKKKVEEEVEELDERDAGNKAKKDAAVAAVGAANKDEKHLTTKGTGIRGSVADKIRGREVTSGKDRMKEEVESIDELSKDTLVSYALKAHRRGDMAARMSKKGDGTGYDKDTAHIANKRYDGVQTAIKKIATKEETDPGFSAEELARLEEIASNIDEVVTARKLTPADKAAKAKYLAAHKAKLASHDTGIEPKKSFKDVNNEPGNYTKQPSKMGLRHSIGAGYYKNDT